MRIMELVFIVQTKVVHSKVVRNAHTADRVKHANDLDRYGLVFDKMMPSFVPRCHIALPVHVIRVNFLELFESPSA